MMSADGDSAAVDAADPEVDRSHRPASQNRPRPGVFLMINSLETGGSERQFAQLARSLSPDGFQLQLGHLQRKGDFLAELPALEHFTLGGSLYRWQSMKTRWRLARHLRRSNVAIAHAFDFYTNLTLVPAARLAGTAVVVASQRQLGDLLTPAHARAQAVMFRLSDCVIANSRAAADRLIQQGIPKSKIVVIPNGLAEAAFADAVPTLPRRPGQLRVGMIARMNARSKNHWLFLAAASRLKDRLHGTEFVFVGDGPLRPELELRAQTLGLADSVRFLGDRRDIPAVLASLDISVLPSASESLSNVILESMAAGVPVVAYNVGGNPELIGEDRGILVENRGEEALAEAIEKLLKDSKARATLGGNARAFAEANFTVDLMRRRHEDLYNQLLARNK
jgi:L-malate glycosyltransferase